MTFSSLARRGAALLAFSSLATPSAAQTSFTASVGRALSSFAESATESRQNTAGSVQAEQRAAGGRLRLFYSLDAGSYATEGDWSYALHNAGATWRFGGARPEGKASPTSVFAGGSFSWRSNGSSWSAADYRGVGLFANLQRQMSPSSTFRVGYRFDARDFPDSSQLDQHEHDVFASFLASFPTRTTLIVEAHAGAKDYRGGLVAAGVPGAIVAAPVTPHGGRGQGGMGPAFRPTTTKIERTPGALSGQVTVLGRIAQSLADRTGVTLQYTRRASFGDLPSVLVTTPAVFFEDGIYDDPFASRVHVVRATAKHVRPGGLEVELVGLWMGKDYRGARALDLDGLELLRGELREDRVWRSGAGVSIPLLPKKTGPVGLALDADYWFTRHRSNDLFYNYRSHRLGLGLTVTY